MRPTAWNSFCRFFIRLHIFRIFSPIPSQHNLRRWRQNYGLLLNAARAHRLDAAQQVDGNVPSLVSQRNVYGDIPSARYRSLGWRHFPTNSKVLPSWRPTHWLLTLREVPPSIHCHPFSLRLYVHSFFVFAGSSCLFIFPPLTDGPIL